MSKKVSYRNTKVHFKSPSKLKKLDKDETLTVRLPLETKQNLESIAKEAGISLSTLVNDIFETYLRQIK
jgi:predicted DNA-binding protein